MKDRKVIAEKFREINARVYARVDSLPVVDKEMEFDEYYGLIKPYMSDFEVDEYDNLVEELDILQACASREENN